MSDSPDNSGWGADGSDGHGREPAARHGSERSFGTRSLAGWLLVATPVLDDPNFFRTVVLMLEHQWFGALGLVLNRPSGTHVGDVLPAWQEHAGLPHHVFVGGPVEPDGFVALARMFVDEIPGWRPIVPGVGLVDLTSSPDQLHDEAAVVRIFAGYAGWSAEQLEMEIAEGAWWVVPVEPGDVITADPDELWRTVVGRQPGRMALLRDHPDDAALN